MNRPIVTDLNQLLKMFEIRPDLPDPSKCKDRHCEFIVPVLPNPAENALHLLTRDEIPSALETTKREVYRREQIRFRNNNGVDSVLYYWHRIS